MRRTQLYTNKHNTTCVGHKYAQINTTQHVSDTNLHKNTTHVSDTTMHKKHKRTCVGHNCAQKTQHNMCRTQLCTKKHNTTCVGHSYAQKTQHNMCRTQLYTKTQHNMCRKQLYTNNVSKTRTLLQTKGGKDEHNIVLMRKSQGTSQDGTLNIKKRKRTKFSF
jgi:hypothetical protein